MTPRELAATFGWLSLFLTIAHAVGLPTLEIF